MTVAYSRLLSTLSVRFPPSPVELDSMTYHESIEYRQWAQWNMEFDARFPPAQSSFRFHWNSDRDEVFSLLEFNDSFQSISIFPFYPLYYKIGDEQLCSM